MKIQLISDVHIEFWRGLGGKQATYNHLQTLLRPADLLVVAGDLHTGRQNVLEALEFLAGEYQDVIYTPGNHEYYSGLAINDFNTPEFVNRLPKNVHFLNPGTVNIGGVKFIGAALWTDFHNDPLAEQAAVNGINDFTRINTTTQIMKETNEFHKHMLKEYYAATPQAMKCVFVTHFLPAMACVSEQYRDKPGITGTLNKYFANNMDDWIAELDDATWLFGHTHDYVDIVIGQTRCLAAPVGYPSERNFYTPLVIDL